MTKEKSRVFGTLTGLTKSQIRKVHQVSSENPKKIKEICAAFHACEGNVDAVEALFKKGGVNAKQGSDALKSQAKAGNTITPAPAKTTTQKNSPSKGMTLNVSSTKTTPQASAQSKALDMYSNTPPVSNQTFTPAMGVRPKTFEHHVSSLTDTFHTSESKIRRKKKEKEQRTTVLEGMSKQNRQLLLKVESLEKQKQDSTQKHKGEIEEQKQKYQYLKQKFYAMERKMAEMGRKNQGLKIKYDEMKELVIKQRQELRSRKDKQKKNVDAGVVITICEPGLEDGERQELEELRKMKEAIMYMADTLR